MLLLWTMLTVFKSWAPFIRIGSAWVRSRIYNIRLFLYSVSPRYIVHFAPNNQPIVLTHSRELLKMHQIGPTTVMSHKLPPNLTTAILNFGHWTLSRTWDIGTLNGKRWKCLCYSFWGSFCLSILYCNFIDLDTASFET